MQKEIISYCFFFWELKYLLFHFWKYRASFVNTKERSSFYQLSALKKISYYSFFCLKIHKIFLFSWYELSVCAKFMFFLIIYYFFSWKIVSFNLLKRSKIILITKRNVKVNEGTFFSEFSMVTAWYITMLVVSKIPWSRIWHLNFAETKTKSLEC